jgi:hypothetical protein
MEERSPGRFFVARISLWCAARNPAILLMRRAARRLRRYIPLSGTYARTLYSVGNPV